MNKLALIIALCLTVSIESHNQPPPSLEDVTPSSSLSGSLDNTNDSSSSQLPSSSQGEASSSESLPQSSSDLASSTPASSSSEISSLPSSSAPVSSSEPASGSAAATAYTGEAQSAENGRFISSIEDEILEGINLERWRRGLPKLTMNDALRTGARIRSKELYVYDYFAHTRPNGDNFSTVAEDEAPYDYQRLGENLAMIEWDNPHENYHEDIDWWVQGWIDSPPHYEVMMTEEYEEIGVGLFYIEVNGDRYAYATTLFGNPSD